jgi:fatty acid desaturase
MPTSPPPNPDDHDGLSPWERQVLARIEDDLVTTDPRLADEMHHRTSASVVRWWPLTARSTFLLIVALFVLAAVGALVPAAWWAVLGPVTTLVVVPWLLFAAMEKKPSN